VTARRLLLCLLAAVAAGTAIAAPAPAPAAAPVDSFQIQTYIGNRIWNQTSWIPFAVDDPPGATVRLTHGGHSSRGIWIPVSLGGPSTAFALQQAWRGRKSTTTAVIADARLTATQRRRFVTVADLYREADVLVVARDHPACAGLTKTQARAIVRGGIERWSEVVPGAAADAIRVRFPSSGGDDLAESHFGVTRPLKRFARMPYAPGAKGASDGGVGAAAAGDQSIAAISTWSRVRGYGASVCAVPLDGVAPTDDTVRSLQFPAAFPVAYVRPRKSAPAYKLAQYDAMARLFASEKFQAMLAGRGVLLP
jgi:hypothetical protein